MLSNQQHFAFTSGFCDAGERAIQDQLTSGSLLLELKTEDRTILNLFKFAKKYHEREIKFQISNKFVKFTKLLSLPAEDYALLNKSQSIQLSSSVLVPHHFGSF